LACVFVFTISDFGKKMVHAANLKLVQSQNKENVFVFYCICCCF